MLDGPRWLTSCDVAPNADATEALFFHTTNKPADDVIVTYDSPDAPGGTATIHTGPAPVKSNGGSRSTPPTRIISVAIVSNTAPS